LKKHTVQTYILQKSRTQDLQQIPIVSKRLRSKLQKTCRPSKSTELEEDLLMPLVK